MPPHTLPTSADPIPGSAGHPDASPGDARAWRQPPPDADERDRLLAGARATDAYQQLARCFAPGEPPIEQLSLSALHELAAGRRSTLTSRRSGATPTPTPPPSSGATASHASTPPGSISRPSGR